MSAESHNLRSWVRAAGSCALRALHALHTVEALLNATTTGRATKAWLMTQSKLRS